MPGYGPKVQRDAPQPRAPRYTLIGAADVVDEPDERWANGVELYGWPKDTPDTFDQCDSSTSAATKATGTAPKNSTYGAFTVLAGVFCTARGMGPDGELMRRLRTSFTAIEAFAVEREFEQGLLLPSNPHLNDGNAQVVAGGTVGPLEGFARLERAIADTGLAGFIHATVELATYWKSLNLVEAEGGKLRAVATGTIVVPGYGYQGVPPQGGATAVAAGGEQWAYATGPVAVRRGGLIPLPDDLSEAFDRVNNTVQWRIERLYQVGWDTVLQAAVKIDRIP